MRTRRIGTGNGSHVLERSSYEAALAGQFEYLGHIYEQWLPKDGPILEAGCGRGQIVLALRAREWDAEGIDYSEDTVAAVKQLFPDAPIRSGDVTHIDVADNHYAGYISIGVIEHRQAGPEPFLDEAYRVLRPGGIGVITVPYVHPIRAWESAPWLVWRSYARPAVLPIRIHGR